MGLTTCTSPATRPTTMMGSAPDHWDRGDTASYSSETSRRLPAQYAAATGAQQSSVYASIWPQLLSHMGQRQTQIKTTAFLGTQAASGWCQDLVTLLQAMQAYRRVCGEVSQVVKSALPHILGKPYLGSHLDYGQVCHCAHTFRKPCPVPKNEQSQGHRNNGQ